MKKQLTAALLALVPSVLPAGEVEIVDVDVRQTAGGYQFDVTLLHGDTGWDHYADAWEIHSPEGETLGRRVLYHPHVGEQPFTRSLGNVDIPDNLDHVLIRARDNVHGYASKTFRVDLPH